MQTDPSRYPLTWPDGWPRTKGYKRKSSKFKCTLAQARDGVLKEVEKLAKWKTTPVLSSDLMLRQDGLPYARQRTSDLDPGVALYWVAKNGKPMVIACDVFDRLEHNMRAIQRTLEALRGIERWGASHLLERAYSGFLALPPSPTEYFLWHEVLGLRRHADTAAVKEKYRTLCARFHPDAKGEGDGEKYHRIQMAWQAFKRERGL